MVIGVIQIHIAQVIMLQAIWSIIKNLNHIRTIKVPSSVENKRNLENKS